MSLLTTFLRRSIHCNRGVHYGVTYNEPNNVASGGICDDCGTVIKPIIWPRRGAHATMRLEEILEQCNDGYDNLRSWDVSTALHAAKDDIQLLRDMIDELKTQNEVLLHRLNELQNQGQ